METDTNTAPGAEPIRYFAAYVHSLRDGSYSVAIRRPDSSHLYATVVGNPFACSGIVEARELRDSIRAHGADATTADGRRVGFSAVEPTPRYGMSGGNLLATVGLLRAVDDYARGVDKPASVEFRRTRSGRALVSVNIGARAFGSDVDSPEAVRELAHRVEGLPDGIGYAHNAARALVRTLDERDAAALLSALVGMAHGEADDDGPMSRAIIGAADSIQRADYFRSVEGIASEILDRMTGERDSSGELVRQCADWDDVDEAVRENVDGSAWIIYTARARSVLALSDNSDAYEDVNGEPGASAEARAFYAMEADVLAKLDELAAERFGEDFDRDDVDTWRTEAQRAEDDDAEDDDDDGCPVDDPDCLGRNGDCHDACERPDSAD